MKKQKLEMMQKQLNHKKKTVELNIKDVQKVCDGMAFLDF